MASAKKCDVCGKLYESPTCDDIVSILLDFKHIDLCDDCYNRICYFLKPALPENYSTERRKSWGE